VPLRIAFASLAAIAFFSAALNLALVQRATTQAYPGGLALIPNCASIDAPGTPNTVDTASDAAEVSVAIAGPTEASRAGDDATGVDSTQTSCEGSSPTIWPRAQPSPTMRIRRHVVEQTPLSGAW
jgi:hypothetical protein